MKFEVGKYYRRADGVKLLCVHVWESGTGLFVRPDKFGYACHTAPDSGDNAGEWKDPRKWTVYLCERHGKAFALVDVDEPLPPEFTIIARTELTEGDGL